MVVENVETVVEQVIDALNRRDAEALATLTTPDGEFHSRLAGVEGRPYCGEDGFREFFSDFEGSFAEAVWELAEIVGWSGDDLLLVLHVSGRGQASGAPIDVLAPQVWTFRSGKIWRNVVYSTREEALEATGLGE
jgi:ketosteroid isomerase-like protein